MNFPSNLKRIFCIEKEYFQLDATFYNLNRVILKNDKTVKFHNVVDAFLFALSNLRELGVTK
jgi:hypothetical protein